MSNRPLVPDYGSTTLSDVVPSIGAAAGVPGPWHNALGLPEASRWVIFMVDGLGAGNLRAASEHAPFLSSLWSELSSRSITSGVPSTTATSLTCLGTGLVPGQHGIAGYCFRDPIEGGVLNALSWRDGLSGLDMQPQMTAFERFEKAGVQVTNVSPARFKGSGLTTAGLRGGRFIGVPDELDTPARVRWAAEASQSGETALVYLYERFLDHAGHGQGCKSDAWRDQLVRIDGIAAHLRSVLPDDTRLLITGDHGMIDVPDTRRIVIEEEAVLTEGVDLIAGEGRLRQLYGRDPGAIAARWADRLGEIAWVRTREEAVAEGWFGTMSPRMADRFGDVLVAMQDDWALMTTTQEKEFSLVGMHGSLTAMEMTVPLLVS